MRPRSMPNRLWERCSAHGTGQVSSTYDMIHNYNIDVLDWYTLLEAC